jgi:hypothetical protein
MRASRRLALAAVSCLAATGGVVTAIALPAGAAAPVFGYGAAQFVNSAAPSTLESPVGPIGLGINDTDLAGEPSIGINWQSGAGMYMAGLSTYRLSFDNTATPPAVTWADATSPYSPANIDPILATNSATGTTIAGGDTGPCAAMSITHDDGATWLPTTPCPFTGDHPTVGIGPAAPGGPALGDEVAYFCQQQVVDECSHSLDGGTTWSPGVTDPTLTCLSLHGHVKISPDGTAYVPSSNCADADGNLAVGAFVTTDNGLTWSGYGIPNAPTPADGFDPSVATDSSNRVYESWARADDYNPVITWSDDHGATWAPQVDLANTVSPALTASTFQAVVAGDAGRAAVAYLATTDPLGGKDPFASGFVGHWYLYVSTTYDGGSTWQTVQATPDPVQIGEIDAGGTTTGGQRNLLDFMDASLTKDGRIVVGYADGCLAGCNSVASSQDAYATVAYQSAGQGMFAAYDTAAPTTAPASPTVNATVDTSKGATVLDWAAPDDGGSPITGYQVYRGLTPGSATPYATSAGTSFTDTAVTTGTTYYYRVVATNAVGSSDPSNEVNATPTTLPGKPTLLATAGKSQVKLSWTAPANGGTPITGYAIYRGTAAGAETLVQTLSTGTSYVDTGLSAKTTYFYEVAAINRNGNGAQSNEVSSTPKK